MTRRNATWRKVTLCDVIRHDGIRCDKTWHKCSRHVLASLARWSCASYHIPRTSSARAGSYCRRALRCCMPGALLPWGLNSHALVTWTVGHLGQWRTWYQCTCFLKHGQHLLHTRFLSFATVKILIKLWIVVILFFSLVSHDCAHRNRCFYMS